MVSPSSVVLYDLRDQVAVITLNRPDRLNAVSTELVEGLCKALDQAVLDEAAAVIVTGSGRSFCSGHDLKDETPVGSEAEEHRKLQRIQDITRKIRQAPFPVIAAVHGYALGAGCEFALCCDLIVAGEDAEFGFPEVSVGLSVTGGISSILPWAVGSAKAKEMVLLGERFGATEAHRLGLVNTVADRGEHLAVAMELAEILSDRPRRAMALAKSSLDRGAQSSIELSLENEVVNAMALRGNPDALAAASGFRNRPTRAAE